MKTLKTVLKVAALVGWGLLAVLVACCSPESAMMLQIGSQQMNDAMLDDGEDE